MRKIIAIVLASFFQMTSNSQIINTIAGIGISGNSGDQIPALTASFGTPISLATDSIGNIYFADYNNNRVRKVDITTGIITHIAGNGGSGFGGDGGLAGTAVLNKPSGICIDKYGDLFIADKLNKRIRKVNLTTGIITTIAGGGTNTLTGVSTLSANIDFPTSICYNKTDNKIYFTASNQIKKIPTSVGIINFVANYLNNAGFSGDGGGSYTAQLDNPSGICASDSGDIYVCDINNNRIRKISKVGIITTFVGSSTTGFSGDGGLANSALIHGPASITYSSKSNDILFGEIFNAVIRKINLQSNIITTHAGNGTSGFSGDGGLATNAQVISNQTGLSADRCDGLFIGSGFRIRKVTNSPSINASGLTTFCQGDSIQLTSSPALSYTWSPNNSTSQSIYATTTGTYILIVNQSISCTSSASISVVVNPTPIINVNNGFVCLGNTYSITPSGANSYTYSSGSAVVSPTANASYTITGTSTQGCVNSVGSICTLTVYTIPTIAVNNGTICNGQSFTLNPTGANTYTYSSGSSVVSPTSNATYTITGTTTQGCINSIGAISLVTVNPLPTLIAITNNTLLCIGETTTLSVTGANTYTWNTNSNVSFITVSPTVQTIYTVSGTDTNGCENTITLTQNVSLCTAIYDIENEFETMTIYPNPFKNVINVASNKTKQTLLLFNSLGSIIFNTVLEAEKTEIDLSNQLAGIYFIKIGDIVKKIVKE